VQLLAGRAERERPVDEAAHEPLINMEASEGREPTAGIADAAACVRVNQALKPPPLCAGFDRDPRALSQLVAAACQVGGLGGIARQLDGFVVRRARLLTAAQPAQQVGAGRMVGVIAGQPVLKTVDGR
jgi:hypothetical protein